MNSMLHFSLERITSENVAGMWRSLLPLLGVRKFARKPKSIDDDLFILLSNGICTYCKAVVYLDVVRVARMWTARSIGDEHDKSHESKWYWAYEFCGNDYDVR